MAIKRINAVKVCLYAVVLLVFASATYAEASMSVPSEVNFGEVARNTTVSKQFTITNNGDVNLTSINLSSDAAGYNVTFDKSGFNLTTGASENIEAGITVPHDSDTGNNITIGNVIINSEQLSKNIPMRLTIKGGLGISDFRISVSYNPAYALRKSGDRKKSIEGVADGADLDIDVEPESELTFDIKVENLFRGKDNDIREVTGTITIEEIDDGEDLDADTNVIDLDAEEEEWIAAKLKIPKRVEQRTYVINFFLEGEGESNEVHTLEWNLEMPITKNTHDVRFDVASLQQNALSCNRKTELFARVYNAGSSNENNIKLEIKNDELGINYVNRDIILADESFDDDSIFGDNIPIVVGSSAKPGVYPIKLNLFWQETVLFDERTLNLEIKECGETKQEAEEEVAGQEPEKEPVKEEEPEEEKQEKEKVSVPIILPSAEPAKQESKEEESIPVTKEVTFKNSPLFWPLVIGGNIVVLVSVFALAFYLARK